MSGADRLAAGPWLLGALAALLALLAPACGPAGDAMPELDASTAPVLGEPDPDWTVQTLDGRAMRLGDLRGRVVLVNLWATWCPPCVQEMPALQALADAFADEAVSVLPVGAADEDPVTVRRFAEQHGYRLPFARPVGPLPAAFDAGGLLPATFVLDRAGRVRHRHVGFRDWNAPDVHDFVRGLLDVEA